MASGGDSTAGSSSTGIAVQLQAGSLYQNALISLTAVGAERFELEFDEYSTVFAVQDGRMLGERAVAAAPTDRGTYVARAELLGWLAERVVLGARSQADGSAQYGQNYWPFVSSRLVGDIAARGTGICTLEVALGAPIRVVGNIERASAVTAESDLAAWPEHAWVDDGWRHLYRWREPQRIVHVDFRVRLGGALLGRLVPIAVYAWWAALAAIAVAASYASAAATGAAVAALGAFALRVWSTTERPQRPTPLGTAYAFGVLLAIVWSVVWRADTSLGFALTPVMLVVGGLLLASNRRFETTGALPRIVEVIWSRALRGKTARFHQAHPVVDYDRRWTRNSRVGERDYSPKPPSTDETKSS